MHRFHRFSPTSILNFLIPITIGICMLSLAACGGSSKSGSSSVVSTNAVFAISIAPQTATVGVNAAQAFTATVVGDSNTAVTWSVAEAGGGTVDNAGKYIAAPKVGIYHVIATSQDFPTQSATATVTVTAPAPTFTSSAPTAAVEGSSYSYVLAATDPSGANDVTFALTTSPDGATLSGGTVTWTPTSSQSRISNAFTVTATTATGASSTQSWTVTPNGTIRGSWIDNYWGTSGETPAPHDLTNASYSVSALAPNSDGSFTNIAGTGNADGTFTIPNVPAGYYWLNFWNYGVIQSFWTNSSTYDLGSDYSGQDTGYVCEPLTLTVSGLDSTQDGSSLGFVYPAQNAAFGILGVPPGTTSISDSNSWTCVPSNPGASDTSYLVQEESNTWQTTAFSGSAWVAGAALALPTSTVASGSVTGTLTTNPQSVDLPIQGAAWAADFANVGSAAATPQDFDAVLSVQPFVSNIATSTVWDNSSEQDTGLWELYSGGVSSNFDSGTIQYNDPYPSSWLPVYGGYADATIADAYGDWVENAYATTTPPTSGIAPLMSPIQNPTMNGVSLFTTGTSSNTTSVTLSWTAPTGLAPYGYEINYYCVDSSCPNNSYGDVYSSSTSVTLPPGLLAPGYDYEFDIAALADSRASIVTSPWRSGYPQAFADVVSAPLLINANATAAPIEQLAKPVSAAKQNLTTHTKTGTFLVTKTGNKPLDAKARILARFNRHRDSKKSTSSSTGK